MISALYFSHSLLRLCHSRVPPAWAPVMGICLALIILFTIVATIVLSLIPVFLYVGGHRLSANSSLAGIRIGKIISPLIKNYYFLGIQRFNLSFITNIRDAEGLTITNFSLIAEQMS